MKILVVGGAGYIGSICAELMLNEDHQIGIFDNLTEGHLADRSAIKDALAQYRPDAVMHFAASALVGESMQNPSKYFRNNVANGINLLDAMVELKIRNLIFSSTCAIF